MRKKKRHREGPMAEKAPKAIEGILDHEGEGTPSTLPEKKILCRKQ